jgi:hypothetical protein
LTFRADVCISPMVPPVKKESQTICTVKKSIVNIKAG